MAGLLLYYITDRSQFEGNESARRAHLLERVEAAAHAGVDYIQLREKDLPARELEVLAASALQKTRGTKANLLINSRIDVGIAVGAHGVHLRSDDVSAQQAREIFEHSGISSPVIGVSCHTLDEVRNAEGADFIVFGPVFEKARAMAAGLERLREACSASAKIPVLALGGVTAENAAGCIHAGAAGVAGIRLFQRGDLAATVKQLRAL